MMSVANIIKSKQETGFFNLINCFLKINLNILFIEIIKFILTLKLKSVYKIMTAYLSLNVKDFLLYDALGILNKGFE